MRRAASQPNILEGAIEPDDDAERRHRTAALGLNHGSEAGREPAVGSEGLPKIGVDWDQPAAAVLGCNIAQLDHRSDVTGWTDHHDPRQVGDLTGP
jgi:hypothetical protein